MLGPIIRMHDDRMHDIRMHAPRGRSSRECAGSYSESG
jgi:hypothetical protein